MDFWDEYVEWGAPSPAAKAEREGALPASSQDDTSGVCDFCGYAGDNVLLGVCADCAKED